VRFSLWGTIPFLSLFCFGYGYMGLMSIMQAVGFSGWHSLWRPFASLKRT
jgi:hypothetical protein